MADLQLKYWPSQKKAKEEIQAAIDCSDRAVYRALALVYKQQTDSEKEIGATTDANSRGFSAFDAEILTSFADQLRRRGYLTPKQLELCRKKIKHYWKQLMLMREGVL